MKAVRINFDEALLRVVDDALERTKQNRSEFVRDAIRVYLHRLEVLEKEVSDRIGYARMR